MNLLTPSDLSAVKSALTDVVDTFFKITVTINKRTTKLDDYGEHAETIVTKHDVRALADYSVGQSGRYQNVDKTEMGQRLEDSWHIYFWKSDLDAIPLTVDPESDTMTLEGTEYEIKLFVPSAAFSDLSFLLYEAELKLVSGVTP